MSSDSSALGDSSATGGEHSSSSSNSEPCDAARSHDSEPGQRSEETSVIPESNETPLPNEVAGPPNKAGSEEIPGCSTSDTPENSQEPPPPSYEASATDTLAPQQNYYQPLESVESGIEDITGLPRQFVIVQIQVAGPSTRRDSAAPLSFEVRPDMDSPPLFTISREASRRQEKKKSPSNSTGISVSLFRADASSDIVSEWTSSESSDHITCGCPRCKEITLRTSGRLASDFSLQVSTPSGHVDGYVQLNHDTMDVTGPEKWTPLFTVDARPGRQKRRQIRVPFSTHPVGSVEIQDDAVVVRLPDTNAPAHDILLLSGIFATLFVPKVWRDESELPKEDVQCCDEQKCLRCMQFTCFCCWCCFGICAEGHRSG